MYSMSAVPVVSPPPSTASLSGGCSGESELMRSSQACVAPTSSNNDAANAASYPSSSSGSGGGEEAFVESIESRIGAMGTDQSELNVKLSFLLRGLEDISDRISKSHSALQAELYVDKIRKIKVAMTAIDERLARLKARMNNARDTVRPPNQAFVEEGSYRYRCCYEGGVMYRAYPSGSAKKTGTVLACGEEVIICERICITGENSVFLHHSDKGYLIENRGSLVCMQRIS